MIFVEPVLGLPRERLVAISEDACAYRILHPL